MSTITQNQYLAILNSCADNCKSDYCFFRIFLEHQHPDSRTLCQFKCIEIYKWEESEKVNHDIGLHAAGLRWCNEGWAKAFAQVYEEGASIREIYRRTKALLELTKLMPTAQIITNPANVSSQAATVVTTII